MAVKLRNEFKFLVLCAMLGATVGAIIWLFLKVMVFGTNVIWEWVPNLVSMPLYTVIICTLGGFGIGVFRKRFGDLPEDLDKVLGEVKTEKRYSYDRILLMLGAAMLPLLLGASIGPEAGLTGVIVGLCYWIGDNLQAAKQSSDKFTEVGKAVTLGVLFHSPLFGLFEVTESKSDEEPKPLPKSSKILSYGICIAAGFGMYTILGNIFGVAMHMPSLEMSADVSFLDCVLLLIYVAGGIILGLFYEATHHGLHMVGHKLPPVVAETVAGLCLGIIGTLVPLVMFSGEEAMGDIPEMFVLYAPLFWIFVAFLKVLLTNLCIQFGLKGGHFFPLIFAGVALGFGLAGIFSSDMSHLVFGAGITTASLLGVTMKKPFAVAVLMLMCFPAKLLFWFFVAAAASSKFIALRTKPVEE